MAAAAPAAPAGAAAAPAAAAEPVVDEVKVGTYKVFGEPYTTYLGMDTQYELPVDTVIDVNGITIVNAILILGKATATAPGGTQISFQVHPNDVKTQKIVKTAGGGRRRKSKKRRSQKRKSRRSRR